MRLLLAAAVVLMGGWSRGQAPPPAVAPAVVSDEARVVADAATVFDQMLTAPGVAIPRAMLAGAEGVAIVPRVIKGGFIVGARHGRGVVITKDAAGVWHAPIFLTLTGGNVGWQAGVQETDVVLVYRTQRSVDSLLAGKLTIGADVAAAAGPVGRQAAAATDSRLAAEVYSYSRSRGLFAGVSLDGSVLKIDHAATAAYYRPPGAAAPVVPPAAQQLVARVVAQVEPTTTVPPPSGDPSAQQELGVIGERHALDESATIRDELADYAPRLYRLLDEQWRGYLALPAEVFQGTGRPDAATLAEAAARYDAVAANPSYQSLATRPEFRTVHGLLKHYQQSLSATPTTLDLPPPPR
ncbi:lipid-binding SYLF domain-containing protein [Botrimarina sp.]|uniref:lipid-binding SYLF domain-containing protein n=1 Tax=Botrimarina sp. TaxID=2795802 RepID=UPI0032ECDFAB